MPLLKEGEGIGPKVDECTKQNENMSIPSIDIVVFSMRSDCMLWLFKMKQLQMT